MSETPVYAFDTALSAFETLNDEKIYFINFCVITIFKYGKLASQSGPKNNKSYPIISWIWNSNFSCN